ncbi:MAG: 2,3-bisphosphoglycerate-dependent phosphoglycerate mutase [Candidatus Pelagibacter sp. TMED272]|nr:phosphoglyceromutase [Pelagibacteraceae bacterium]RPG93482.1 MAG: 2,3-bisphosphoglycerate-dependent phosphoglycerate mutase [Candidatus Pelagibacter sp. TMED272]|tara:strand:- start:27811 stop:28530 length:720 start_codon:yes stop_codon:yes gene_type:complete
MSKLILVRHGQSTWNAENRFTGWVDVDLSEKGILEAQKSGRLIKNLNINIDVSYTSFLKRAIKTLTTILQENNLELKFNTSWEINERHYGSLTGLNKEETKKKIGEEQFKKYRRSWDIPPPPIDEKDKNHSLFSPLNASIPVGMIPFTESLKDTYNRVIPYYQKEIEKHIKENKNILISAHGNSLRSLCKYLFKISDQMINQLEIPTGNPLIIELDNILQIQKYYYLDETRAKTIIFNQ